MLSRHPRTLYRDIASRPSGDFLKPRGICVMPGLDQRCFFGFLIDAQPRLKVETDAKKHAPLFKAARQDLIMYQVPGNHDQLVRVLPNLKSLPQTFQDEGKKQCHQHMRHLHIRLYRDFSLRRSKAGNKTRGQMCSCATQGGVEACTVRRVLHALAFETLGTRLG